MPRSYRENFAHTDRLGGGICVQYVYQCQCVCACVCVCECVYMCVYLVGHQCS